MFELSLKMTWLGVRVIPVEVEVEGEVAEVEASSRRRKVVRLREERSSQPRNWGGEKGQVWD